MIGMSFFKKSRINRYLAAKKFGATFIMPFIKKKFNLDHFIWN